MSPPPPPPLSPPPQELQLYPYQQDCVNQAKCMNTIVNLPTGRGKTLIAARLIEYFLEMDPTKKIAFLVPTRPLVVQQAEYCTKNCRVAIAGTCGSCSPRHPVVVQQIVGQDQAGWKHSDWDECIERSHIILGTAALFQQAFVTDKFLDICRFSLIVFDECHNAVGNSPMAAVMRDCVAPLIKRMTSSSGDAAMTTTPRILGLTASFVNGSLRGIEKKRKDLEALLQSTIVCPNVQSKLLAGNDKFRHVHWKRNANIEMHKEAISIHVRNAIDSVGPVKEITKVINRCIHVFEELGLYALEFFIEKVIVQQVLEKAASLRDQIDDAAAVRIANRLLTGLPSLRGNLDVLTAHLKADFAVQQAAPISLKLDRLIQILRQDFAARGVGYRGIVFVEQVALVSPLAKQLNDALGGDVSNIKCGAVAGTGYQNESERQGLLDKFKSGHLQILAATATLEEGIDVSQCEFVVRFTQVPTTKAHIQGAGRARHPDAIVYYFENNPDVERQKEASMEATARNQSLSLNTQEFHAAAVSMSMSVDQVHPYPFLSTIPRAANAQDHNNNNTGEVNVYNCKQIFNEYCSITLGASIKPSKDLYQYSSAPGQQKRLAKIRFPTPNGWRILSEDDYRGFWDNVDLDMVFPAGRTNKKSASDKEEMAFVYMVTVQLRENGFLDCHNKPDTSIRFDTNRRCSLESDWSEAIRFKNVVIQSMRY